MSAATPGRAQGTRAARTAGAGWATASRRSGRAETARAHGCHGRGTALTPAAFPLLAARGWLSIRLAPAGTEGSLTSPDGTQRNRAAQSSFPGCTARGSTCSASAPAAPPLPAWDWPAGAGGSPATPRSSTGPLFGGRRKAACPAVKQNPRSGAGRRPGMPQLLLCCACVSGISCTRSVFDSARGFPSCRPHRDRGIGERIGCSAEKQASPARARGGLARRTFPARFPRRRAGSPRHTSALA